jgi:hypothetical protein
MKQHPRPRQPPANTRWNLATAPRSLFDPSAPLEGIRVKARTISCQITTMFHRPTLRRHKAEVDGGTPSILDALMEAPARTPPEPHLVQSQRTKARRAYRAYGVDRDVACENRCATSFGDGRRQEAEECDLPITPDRTAQHEKHGLCMRQDGGVGSTPDQRTRLDVCVFGRQARLATSRTSRPPTIYSPSEFREGERPQTSSAHSRLDQLNRL